MIKRHDLDKKVVEFITDKFSKKIESNNSVYTSEDKKVQITLWKCQFTRKDKVEVYFNSFAEDGTLCHIDTRYILDFDSSEYLRNFLEGLEDKDNQDELRNTNASLVENLEKWK